MAHKRPGKAAKIRRQERAKNPIVAGIKQYWTSSGWRKYTGIHH